MTKKKIPLPDLKNLKIKKSKNPKNNYTPFIILFVVSILLASLLPYVKSGVQKVNEDVALSQLTQNYSQGLYSEILIDGNKAIATLS